jgi:hypothetical protein
MVGKAQAAQWLSARAERKSGGSSTRASPNRITLIRTGRLHCRLA